MIRAVEFLIARGHKKESVLYEYTYDQFIAFQKEGVKNEIKKTDSIVSNLAVAMRVAYHAKAKEFTKYLNQFNKKEGRAKPTKKEINELKQLGKGRHGLKK